MADDKNREFDLSDFPDADALEEQRLRRQWEKQQELKNAQREKRLREQKRKIKVITGLFGALVLLLVVAIVLTVKVFIPLADYNAAIRMMEDGEYAQAIDAFDGMRGYKEADRYRKECILLEAQRLSGKENVVYGTSETHPWFSVSESGALKFDEKKYRGDWNIVIPDVFDGVLVSEIGDKAFFHCDELTSVTISDCVRSIADYAFYSCSGLTTLTLPPYLEQIGSNAFGDCENLLRVEFGQSLKTIGTRAFISCASLTEIVLPDSVTQIGGYAFNQCKELLTVSVGTALVSIGNYAFTRCENLETFRYRGSRADFDRLGIDLSAVGLTEELLAFGE